MPDKHFPRFDLLGLFLLCQMQTWISRVQRTDIAEQVLEQLAKVPLTWENVFRSPKYTTNTDKEVVDLLLVLRNRGIFISMKCQQNPMKRSGDKLVRWVRKSAKAALKQVRGGIRTSKTRKFWCDHPRRGQVYFSPNQIDPVRAIVIVETFEDVSLDQDIPLKIDSVPVSYLSVKDFLKIVIELRTINDLLRYLDIRCSICPWLQRIVGIESIIFDYYVLYGGSPREVDSLQDLVEEIWQRRAEVESQIGKRKAANVKAGLIEELADRLSKRLEPYDEGLDEEIARQFDPASERSNYLLIQNELCDLVLDERRKLGESLARVVVTVKQEDSNVPMQYQAAQLTSKPEFLYVFSSSEGLSRNEVIKRCCNLLKGGLAYYGKTRGLAVNYTHDLDNFETAMIHSFQETKESRRFGEKWFSKLKISAIPTKKV